MRRLVLTASDVTGPDTWRWRLTWGNGEPLAEHLVSLDRASAEYEGFANVAGYLSWNSAPDRAQPSEEALLARLGDWLGERVFGTVGQKVAEYSPAVVQVVLPAELGYLLHRPLALARIDGKLLAEHASLVFDTSDPRYPVRPKDPVSGPLRMLVVMGSPADAAVVPLHREARRLEATAGEAGGVVELRVLQYGVTRQRLESVLDEAAGWDVIHLSGHGNSGAGIVLQRQDGDPDVLAVDELAGLLRLARSRVKLVVISRNESSAPGISYCRAKLGLEANVASAVPVSGAGPVPNAEPALDSSGFPGSSPQAVAAAAMQSELAVAISRHLDCPVLAMRYPVSEDAAIDFNRIFYRALYLQQNDIATAMHSALAETSAAGISPRSLAVASPALVGPPGTGPLLSPRQSRNAVRQDPGPALGDLPDKPGHFVGRNFLMSRAISALEPASNHRGVVLHGMVGVGKTMFALELAYSYGDEFRRRVWWRAPSVDGDFEAGFASFKKTIERQFNGFNFRSASDDAGGLRQQMMNLTTLLENVPVLLVLDGLDEFVSVNGQWRDRRWKALIDTLLTHQGQSRAIITCRTRPKIDESGGLALPVHSLTMDESIMLALDSPNLRPLLAARADGEQVSPVEQQERRLLLRRVLLAVQGHPKMIELADAAAASPDLPRPAGHAHIGQLAELTAFVGADASPQSGAAGFLRTLGDWAAATLASVPADSRLLLEVLSCMEEADRTDFVVGRNWPGLWARLGQAGAPPAIDAALGPLLACTLVSAEQLNPAASSQRVFRVNRVVADHASSLTDEETRGAVDAELGGFWAGELERGCAESGSAAGESVVRAGLAAAPYLTRSADWALLRRLIQEVIDRDSSSASLGAALPHLRQLAETTGEPEDICLLARAIAPADHRAAEEGMRRALGVAVEREDLRAAASIAEHLAELLTDAGRLRDALQVTNKMTESARDARLGPWTRLAAETRFLDVMLQLGGNAQVEKTLEQLAGLVARMEELPDESGPDEAVSSWSVRESALTIGQTAAIALGRWQVALRLNAANVRSRIHRGATEHEIISGQFNDYRPLLRIGRLDAAENLLRRCRATFDDVGDITGIAQVFSARAVLEQHRDQAARALELQRTALRLRYIQPEARDIAVAHYNMADCLSRAGQAPEESFAHTLAAVLIYHLLGVALNDLEGARFRLAADMNRLPKFKTVPKTVRELAVQVERVEGVRFSKLIDALCPGPGEADRALAELVKSARNSKPKGRTAIPQGYLDEWDSRMASVVAAARGDQHAATAVRKWLDSVQGEDQWSALVRVLRNVLDGDRDRVALCVGLKSADTAIVKRLLDNIETPIPSTSADARQRPGDEHLRIREISAELRVTDDDSKIDEQVLERFTGRRSNQQEARQAREVAVRKALETM